MPEQNNIYSLNTKSDVQENNNQIALNINTLEAEIPEAEIPEVDVPEANVPEAPVIPEVAANSTFIALSENNTVATFNPNNLSDVKTTEVTDIEGDLIGIDTRSADGLVYGVSTENNVYRTHLVSL